MILVVILFNMLFTIYLKLILGLLICITSSNKSNDKEKEHTIPMFCTTNPSNGNSRPDMSQMNTIFKFLLFGLRSPLIYHKLNKLVIYQFRNLTKQCYNHEDMEWLTIAKW